jgi:F-type H+-transporting ATPase subunit delta|tara:strand:- start:314 stop:850 length:537 start_codon:yes stop_codon:yes gene_type:complete
VSELTTAARPYARAAFDYALSKGVTDQWAEMLGFCVQIADDATMKAALDQPGLNRQQTADLFNEVCTDKLDEHAKNFIKLLAENDRISLLPDIAVLYHHYQTEAEGIVDAQLISALEVSDQQVQAISASLAKRLGKKISMTTSIDDSLIGGAIVRAGDMFIDGSVRGRLEKLSNTLTK